MSNCQGKHLAHYELARILLLLRESDLSLAEIATRMNRSYSGIVSVNRRLGIRSYAGMRNQWVVTPGFAESVAAGSPVIEATQAPDCEAA
jgi:hypothetical protein